MNVLYATSEAAPFIKTGGLGDVSGALPKELVKQGVQTRVILPLYSAIGQEWRDKMVFIKYIYFNLAWRNLYCGLFELQQDGVSYYFVDNEYYFKRHELYGHYDDGERFAFFAKAVVSVLPDLGWTPDVIHCNDWQTALVPIFLKAGNPIYHGIKTVFTIHNIEYQGQYNADMFTSVLGLPDWAFTGVLEYNANVNLMKGAIVCSDAVTTVSPTYSEELQYPFYAHGLDGLLTANRHKMSGILNGIDTEVFNPAKDTSLFKKYSLRTLAQKAVNKAELQKLLGLNQDPAIPLVAVISRLTAHKGLDLVAAKLDEMMELDIQFVVLGRGDWHYEHMFNAAQARYPGRFSANILYNPTLANQIYAGADLLMMPSKSEPCGLAQMIAMEYGTLPLVRETGGLKDTVIPYNAATGEGNGFSFANYSPDDLLHVLRGAVALYNDNPKAWKAMQKAGMTTDWSWKNAASHYIELYQNILKA